MFVAEVAEVADLAGDGRDHPDDDDGSVYVGGAPERDALCGMRDASVASNGGDEPGLNQREIRKLANWYITRADELRDGGVDLDEDALAAGLRQILAQRVLPEAIDTEFERVIEAAFHA
jgi:hypothetical protein